MAIDYLPEGITLRLCLRPFGGDSLHGKVLFSSSNKWLHPLFELEAFLDSHAKSLGPGGRFFEFEGGLSARASDLVLRDRIIGSAAAFLVLRLGINTVQTDLAGRRALSLLRERSVVVETLETVDAIACVTEALLKDVTDPGQAYEIIAGRRAQALERMKTQANSPEVP